MPLRNSPCYGSLYIVTQSVDFGQRGWLSQSANFLSRITSSLVKYHCRLSAPSKVLGYFRSLWITQSGSRNSLRIGYPNSPFTCWSPRRTRRTWSWQSRMPSELESCRYFRKSWSYSKISMQFDANPQRPYTFLINAIHSLHEFAHKQKSQLNSSVLVTVWRVVIEKGATGVPT